VSSLLEMSLAGALLIAVTALIRALAIHKLPKKTFLVLWGIVLCRLIIPFSIPSQVSVFNLRDLFGSGREYAQHAPAATYTANPIPFMEPVSVWQVPAGTTDILVVPITPDVTAGAANDSGPLTAISPLMLVYLSGLVLAVIFFAALYIKHRKEFMTSLPVRSAFVNDWLESHKLRRKIRIRVLDTITTPLTYGVFRPVILLPTEAALGGENELQYVLAHEFVHIRRFDALIKLVMAAAVCIHWFNPLVWAMYFIFNRDLEISCDETVIKMFGKASKQDYALTLIGMAERRNGLPVLYSNFSKYAIEERVKSIMKIKKRTLTGTLAALLVVGAVTTVFATSGPDENSSFPLPETSQSAQTQFDVHIEFPEWFTEPGAATVISGEDAAQLGADAIERFFGTDLDGLTINMFYSPRFDPADPSTRPALLVEAIDPGEHVGILNRWADELGMTADEILDYIFYGEIEEIEYRLEGLAARLGVTRYTFDNTVYPVYWGTRMSFEQPAHPSAWAGQIFIDNDRDTIPQYSFMINAETGELWRVSYDPDAAEGWPYGLLIDMLEMFADLSEQHGYEFARHAIQLADERNMLDGGAARARMVSYGASIRGEAIITVWVESANGEGIQLIFLGFMEDEKVLESVMFWELEEINNHYLSAWVYR